LTLKIRTNIFIHSASHVEFALLRDKGDLGGKNIVAGKSELFLQKTHPPNEDRQYRYTVCYFNGNNTERGQEQKEIKRLLNNLELIITRS
jgi:hypothetical protein